MLQVTIDVKVKRAFLSLRYDKTYVEIPEELQPTVKVTFTWAGENGKFVFAGAYDTSFVCMGQVQPRTSLCKTEAEVKESSAEMAEQLETCILEHQGILFYPFHRLETPARRAWVTRVQLGNGPRKTPWSRQRSVNRR